MTCRFLFICTWMGLSWLAVEVMASLPFSLMSQAQPLPKRPAAAALNLFLNSSREPKDSSMAALRPAEGPLLPVFHAKLSTALPVIGRITSKGAA